eukprot:CAMPEP_0175012260 /NCGR_PEP_ID=MMETSP0005-20121125/9205_1 /TAXON_ID=420556 /ORGANISM="Ochromonas sp., Strain CCMP1393" /LENGTH=367 /DNA_ID=CAMNT_0016268467 /DNA_START=231 /DNA_END=1334 /DNA_ORIENTATION=+
MIYYIERDRTVMKGEIVLAGASAVLSTSRADARKKYYFNVTHPRCGTREVYAKSKTRRNQWMHVINEISTEITRTAVFGNLAKQGGLRKSTWQDRWCICAARSFDYFESPTDNQSKGTIELLNATVREYEQKGKFCFEITCAAGSYGKKGKNKDKTYIFSSDKEHELKRWVAAIRRAADPNTLFGSAATNAGASAAKPRLSLVAAQQSQQRGNPLHQQDDDDEDGDLRSSRTSSEAESGQDPDKLRTLSSASFRQSSQVALEKEGWLFKKSPSMLKGWQKRYFWTNKYGDIDYYKNDKDVHNADIAPQGTIRLGDIKRDCGLEVDDETHEITINTTGKSILLKASSHAEALSWISNISSWMDTIGDA